MNTININPLVDIVNEELGKQEDAWTFKTVSEPTQISIRQTNTNVNVSSHSYKVVIGEIGFFDGFTKVYVNAHYENSAPMIEKIAQRIDTETDYKVTYAKPVKGTSFETPTAAPRIG